MIATIADLDALLRPMALDDCETVGFSLAHFKSRVTRELLQIRMRRQAHVFGTADALVAATVSPDGTMLAVDVRALMAANAAVLAQLENDATGPLHFLRRFARSERALADAATAFEAALRSGGPTRAVLLGYVDANTIWQELGALKFCLPATLAARVEGVAPGHHAALVAPWAPSLWTRLRLAELALARARLRGPPARYARALAGFRRLYGYLGGEDVDFEEGECVPAIEARQAGLGDERAIAAAAAFLARARAADQARRRMAATCFAVAAPDAAVVSLVLLARTLAEHEDLNRRAKMRLLRNLRDLAVRVRLPIATVSLRDLAAACENSA